MEVYLNLSVHNIIWCAIILFVASYIRGFSGFGFTAVLMTGLTMILPIVEIVPLSIALELAASFGQSFTIIRNVSWRKLGILAATGTLCTPIGVYLLVQLPDLALRILVLMFIFGSSIYLIFLREHLRTYSLRTYALAGSVIGIVNGATALSGMVLALFFSLTDEHPARIRATMIAFLFLADFWAGGILLASGFYVSVTIPRILFSLPLLGLGVWLGSIHFASVRPETFRVAVLWLLLLLSVLGIVLVMTAKFA